MKWMKGKEQDSCCLLRFEVLIRRRLALCPILRTEINAWWWRLYGLSDLVRMDGLHSWLDADTMPPCRQGLETFPRQFEPMQTIRRNCTQHHSCCNCRAGSSTDSHGSKNLYNRRKQVMQCHGMPLCMLCIELGACRADGSSPKASFGPKHGLQACTSGDILSVLSLRTASPNHSTQVSRQI